MNLFGYPVEEANLGLGDPEFRFGTLDDYNKTTYDRENWWSWRDGKAIQIDVKHLRVGPNSPSFDVQAYRYIRVDKFKLTVEGSHNVNGPWMFIDTESNGA